MPSPTAGWKVATSLDSLGEPVPWGYHNFFVLIVVAFMSLWIAKVAYQIGVTWRVHARLSAGRPLRLERLSLYAQDLQELIRQHFNQILRMRRTVAPQEVDRQTLLTHVRPESLRLLGDRHFGVQFTVDAAVPCSVSLYWGVPVGACNRLHQQFAGGSDSAGSAAAHPNLAARARRLTATRQAAKVPKPAMLSRSLLELQSDFVGSPPSDAASGRADGIDSTVQRREIFAADQYLHCSQPELLPAGLDQAYASKEGDLVDASHLHLEQSVQRLQHGEIVDPNHTLVPLVIAVTALGPTPRGESAEGQQVIAGPGQGHQNLEAYTEVTLVTFIPDTLTSVAPGHDAPPRAEVLHQVTLGDGCAHRVLGVYGFEGEDADTEDCICCDSRPKNILLLPCRHCSVCSSCLRSLRDERCPMCRAAFSAYLVFPVQRGASVRP